VVDHYKVLEAQSGRGENEQLRLAWYCVIIFRTRRV